MRFSIRILLGIAVGLALVTRGLAATFNIANGDAAALISAINAANTNRQHDTINLAANGTYVLTAIDTSPEADGRTGLPPVLRDGTFDEFHNLTINGNGSTIRRSIAVGTPEFRIFRVSNATQAVCTINRVTFSDGRLSAQNQFGGGVLTHGQTVMNDCHVTRNHAHTEGGGIYNTNGRLSLNRCTVSDNTVTNHGGAIANGNAANVDARLTLVNCTLVGNSAGRFGDGIYNEDGQFGNGNAYVTLTHCTLVDASLHASGFNSIASFVLENTILVRSSLIRATNPGNDSTGFVSEGYNMSDGSGNGFLIHSEDFQNTDPGLDPAGLKMNGGLTPTIALVAGSAAIDQGYWNFVAEDQRGFPRPVNVPGVPNNSDGADIGAYEAPSDPIQSGVPSFIVNTLDDHNDGVCSASDCTLREALQATNARPGTGAITFAPGLTGTIVLQTNQGGQLSITEATVITGPGARVLTISGNTNHRIFYVSGSGASNISGLTIANGWNSNSAGGGSAFGGGIVNEASLVVSNCTFDFNRAVGGSAVTPGGNGGNGHGGAIANFGLLTLTGCTFKLNGVTAGFGANNPPPDDFLLTRGGNGGSGRGGAIFNEVGKTLQVLNCTFFDNRASGAAGGSGHFGGNGGSGDGGAICNLGTMFVTACTVTGNQSFAGSGGAGRFSFNNGSAGGATGGLFASGATNLVRSTIVAGNTRPGNGSGFDVSGAFTSEGYNLIGRTNGSSGFTAPTDQTGTNAAPLDPRLSALGNFTGATDTMALLPGSPAIDMGRNFGGSTDQRGVLRTSDKVTIANAASSDGTDIGAFEVADPIVTTVEDSNDGVAGATHTTLREALHLARIQPGNEIIGFAANVSGTVQLGSPLPTIDSDLAIEGPGANVITIRRNSGGDYRILTISNGTNAGPAAAISGLTITNGFANASSFPGDSGGAIYNAHGQLTLRHCAFSGNQARGFGGAVFNEGFGAAAPLLIEGCTFNGNVANGGGHGGGLYNSAAVATIRSSTFSGNSASNGGAISTAGGFGGPGAHLSLTSCTLHGNTGAALFNGLGSTSTLANSIFAGSTGANLATFNAGGIASQGFNLSSDAAGGDAGTGSGGLLNATGDRRNTDPLLQPLSLNFGITPTHPIGPNSPAIDRGHAFGLAFDQRNLPRRADSPNLPNAINGDGTDIGAVEYHPLNGADSDADGMADDFEFFYNVGDPLADPDGDGDNNREEYVAGTDPLNGTSNLRVIAVDRVGGAFRITFSLAVSGRIYRLERKNTPVDPFWNLIPGLPDLRANATGAAELNDPTAFSLGPPQQFYRVRVVP